MEGVYHIWFSWVFLHLNIQHEKTMLCFNTRDIYLVLVFHVSARPAF